MDIVAIVIRYIVHPRYNVHPRIDQEVYFKGVTRNLPMTPYLIPISQH